MKYIKVIISFVLCICVTVLSSCSRADSAQTELSVGVEGMNGCFSPLYAQSEADINVMSQIYQPIQRRGSDNTLINNAGGISYEYIGNTQVKYTVTIRDDLVFSDGTKVTIDDVIFFYHLIADATYDGVYSDWYLNDIEGLKEYYFDDENYYASVSGIENRVAASYSPSNININEYVDYLVTTSLEGKFNGNLDSASPYGKTWRQHLDSLSYTAAVAELDDSPSAEKLTELVAKAEAENNPFSYNPEDWYKEKFYAEYLEENYADGMSVTEISGIKKIDDYSCSILFNSRNINAVSAVNAYIISADYYSVEYVKGSAEKVSALSDGAIGSGAYVLSGYENGVATLKANTYYPDSVDFKKVKFVDYSGKDKTAAKAFIDGEVDIAQSMATADIVSSVNSEQVKYYITNEPSYLSMFASSKNLELLVRRALMGICDVTEFLNSEIGSYFSRPYLPLSIRFPEFPQNITEPVYSMRTFATYELSNVAKLKEITAYYVGTDSDFDYKIIEAYKNRLADKKIKMNIVLTDSDGLDSAIRNGSADIWFERVFDGATCDKYEYFNTYGRFNKTKISTPEIDTLTESIRSAVGFTDKSANVAKLMELVMLEALENPVCQLQVITLYNTAVISPDSFDDGFNYDGYAYAISELKIN